VNHDGHTGRQGFFTALVQGQGLALFDLAPGIAHDLAVDGYQSPDNQTLGFSAGAYARLAQPLVDADRLVAIIGTGEGHRRNLGRMQGQWCRGRLASLTRVIFVWMVSQV